MEITIWGRTIFWHVRKVLSEKYAVVGKSQMSDRWLKASASVRHVSLQACRDSATRSTSAVNHQLTATGTAATSEYSSDK